MKDQSRPLWKTDIGVGHYVYALPWGKGGYSHLIEVVGRATIGESAAFVLFEEEGIDAVVVGSLQNRLLEVEVPNGYERMERRPAVVFVEVLNGIERCRGSPGHSLRQHRRGLQ